MLECTTQINHTKYLFLLCHATIHHFTHTAILAKTLGCGPYFLFLLCGFQAPTTHIRIMVSLKICKLPIMNKIAAYDAGKIRLG